MTKKLFPMIISASALVLLLASASVRAGESGAYLRVDGGFTFADDLKLEIGTQTGKMKLDTGYRFDVDLGYDFNRWVSLQLEGGFFNNSAESVLVQNLAAHLNNTWHEGIPLMIGPIFHYPNSTDFMPYVGGGAGGVVSMLSIDRNSDTAFVFGYQLTLGVIYKLDERAWIDLSYKFLNSDNCEYELGGVPVKSSRVRHHFMGAGITWIF